MAGEEAEKLDFDEFMEAIEERRRERREQVSFEWVKSIREAGELYRESEDIDAVSDELNRPEERIREAVTVYRLIFEKPPEEVAVKASTPGRAFFSLEQEVTEELDDDEEEPIEDLLREYVGAVYLEHNVDEEPVGEPPEGSTPPPAVDFAEIGEEIADSFTFPTESILAASRIGEFQKNILEPFAASQASILANITEPIAAQQASMIASIAEPMIARQERMVSSLVAASLPDMTKHLQLQQSIVNSAISGALSDAMTGIQVPEPILADLASIQPAINAAAVAGRVESSPVTGRSRFAEASTTTVEAESLEASGSTVPSTGPADATMEAATPNADAFSTELAFEIPAMLVQSILGTGPVRAWFNGLPRGAQQSVIGSLMVGLSYYFTQDLTLSGIAATIMTPGLREILTDD
ncbi:MULTISPECIES: hypothetical protein [unclassified Haloferax]|jgi:hypothetical protein|uniref:hypothetical protein n=1 Tax=unclassified Haloferax TaxID=2625095 RepID=UPI000E25A464|nr:MULTISPECIES: hypothetical protein [unclassified Haloferax]RDZ32119.1 hypothetical protein C5B88_18930 [Haloferax sp. Atlit-24N]RLM33212.1 hypothetical protein DVK03_18935 [Haloferax sp. Atlit-109R]RLM40648.1 hypothetical protein DVK04_18810 [Haloferax sp. Atlit-105R]